MLRANTFSNGNLKVSLCDRQAEIVDWFGRGEGGAGGMFSYFSHRFPIYCMITLKQKEALWFIEEFLGTSCSLALVFLQLCWVKAILDTKYDLAEWEDEWLLRGRGI